ncbi:MAG: hypothetical protein QG637_1382 [Chloroflexota bacterium]|nr:hypothetical protein [Chloroflexota bacterium]
MTVKSWDREAAALRAVLADLAPLAPTPRGEGCETAQMHLDLFVSDELDGVDVRRRHLQIWQHLQLCEDCRADHDRLFSMLAAEIEGRLPALPPRRAAPPPAHEEPWRLEVVPASGPARPALQFIFAPAYLRQSLRPAAVTGRRAADAPAADCLLLSYLGAPATGEVMVQLYAQPAPAGALTVALVAAGDPMPTTAELTWGGRAWTVTLGQDGEAVIGPVPAAALSEERPAAFSLRLLY